MVAKNWHSLPEYQALRAMMEAGTTAQAGVRLGLSQSAISRSIASLEARTGRMLFERDGNRLRPTGEALRLNKRLDPLFAALDGIDNTDAPPQETLRMIAPPTYAHRFLVAHIATFLKANPTFFVSLEVAPSDKVIAGIETGAFDLGLTGVELSHDGVKLLPYRAAPAVCAMQPDHPLAAQQTIAPGDLHEQPLIALAQRHARRAQLDKVLHGAKSVPRVMAEVSTSFAAVDLVREGVGLTIVNPFPIVHYRSAEVAFRQFLSKIEYRSYFVISDQRPASRIARAFMRHQQLHTVNDRFSRRA